MARNDYQSKEVKKEKEAKEPMGKRMKAYGDDCKKAYYRGYFVGASTYDGLPATRGARYSASAGFSRGAAARAKLLDFESKSKKSVDAAYEKYDKKMERAQSKFRPNY